MVEFALENTNQPIGVSTYQVTRELPPPMQEDHVLSHLSS